MKRIISILLVLVLLFSVGCSKKEKKTEQTKVRFVLDWTPNTNHTGLYVAKEKGYFKEANIELEIVAPPQDGATSLVAANKAEFGVGFQDFLSGAFAKKEPLPVTAVLAVINHNTSGILTMKEKGIDSPKKLEGKKYATWDAPIEKAIIKNVVEKDGGDYSKVKMIPNTVTDIVQALKTNIDAVWSFYAWDGIIAKHKGLKTNFIAFKDVNPVFDYYTPVIIANNKFLKENKEVSKKFVQALVKGYEFAIKNPKEAADILIKNVPELDKEIIYKSQEWISKQYKADGKKFGYIDPKRWNNFFKWLHENKLVEMEIPKDFGFTNEFNK